MPVEKSRKGRGRKGVVNVLKYLFYLSVTNPFFYYFLQFFSLCPFFHSIPSLIPFPFPFASTSFR